MCKFFRDFLHFYHVLDLWHTFCIRAAFCLSNRIIAHRDE